MESVDFLFIKLIRSLFFSRQCSSVYFPGDIFNSLNTFTTPPNPSLNEIIAEATPSSSVVRPTKASFGQRFHINPFKDSLLFWVLSCKHWLNNFSLLSEINTAFIVSL